MELILKNKHLSFIGSNLFENPFSNYKHLSINTSWINGKLHGSCFGSNPYRSYRSHTFMRNSHNVLVALHLTSLLLECGDSSEVRNKGFHVDNMKQLF